MVKLVSNTLGNIKNKKIFKTNHFNLVARHFITRALLSAESFEQALDILKDVGVGAADGCSININFIKLVKILAYFFKLIYNLWNF